MVLCCVQFIVDMYAKCRRIRDAIQAFDELGMKNLIAWNTIITGYTLLGDNKRSIALLKDMQKNGIVPGEFKSTSILKACSVAADSSWGTQVHAPLIARGFPVSDLTALIGALLDLYVRCGYLVKDRKLFDYIEDRCVVSWASLVLGYAQEGYFM
ncbi:hypothetical protein RDABS01_016455 [Bienertia sinuspersici]